MEMKLRNTHELQSDQTLRFAKVIGPHFGRQTTVSLQDEAWFIIFFHGSTSEIAVVKKSEISCV